MKRLQKVREARGDTKAAASRRADINASTWGLVESGRFVPYAVQVARMAAALEFDGDPQALLDEVDGDV